MQVSRFGGPGKPVRIQRRGIVFKTRRRNPRRERIERTNPTIERGAADRALLMVAAVSIRRPDIGNDINRKKEIKHHSPRAEGQFGYRLNPSIRR
jgi:hypothetical protein